MEFFLFDILNKKKEKFIPNNKELVKFYGCGPTVYGPIHIGNARSMVIYDIFYRILRHIYGKTSVTFIRNITDIDDKIINKALEENISPKKLALKNIDLFRQDMRSLNCLEPTHQPLVSENIELIIDLINKLIISDNAYLKNGNVYFKISTYQDYFALSGRNKKESQPYVRIEQDINKQNAEDFILWKAVKSEKEMSFASPFGIGRPGWHIECSAMIYKFLGTDIDLHAGGKDLIFPHHSNEIAQSKSLFPESNFVKYWVHNGLLTINGQKMSKSLNNIITVEKAQKMSIAPAILRLFFLNTHYSKNLDYNEKSVMDIKNMFNYWQNSLRNLQQAQNNLDIVPKDFLTEILSNLNTHNGITILNDKIKHLNKIFSLHKKNILAQEIFAALNFLGIQNICHTNSTKNSDTKTINSLIKLREKMRKEKNWSKADEIKNSLLKKYKIQILDKENFLTEWYFLN
ncbi:MAG: cysteine--tRNA ligase [Rickettsia sp.]|nr:cysteine--tRNA ligase [Rickettsia sp.]